MLNSTNVELDEGRRGEQNEQMRKQLVFACFFYLFSFYTNSGCYTWWLKNSKTYAAAITTLHVNTFTFSKSVGRKLK